MLYIFIYISCIENCTKQKALQNLICWHEIEYVFSDVKADGKGVKSWKLKWSEINLIGFCLLDIGQKNYFTFFLTETLDI